MKINKTNILPSIVTIALVCTANFFLSNIMFNNYFPVLDINKIFSSPSAFAQNTSFKQLLADYDVSGVVPIIINQKNSKNIVNSLDTDYLSRYSSVDGKQTLSDLLDSPFKGFSTTAPRYGKQSFCPILYTNETPYIENGRWKVINDQDPLSIPLLRMSVLHELEHCMTPKWRIQNANENLGLPLSTPQLSEALADAFAITFSPHTVGIKDLLYFRKIVAEKTTSDKYAINYELDKKIAVSDYLYNNSDNGRLFLLRNIILNEFKK